ncbi:MAG: ATP synthase F1 subunit delta [Clostridia bacterium]|jgi:F-type H+-transporting ATPase subunit delta|nr:ATP synthase F1 subunit delta [Clostridia bacterium]NLS85170.1 ATP synthase F1 subunit delta [Oscillospiraceae bacterium]
MTGGEKEYGRALFELAYEENVADDVLTSLDFAQQIFAENPDYLKLLSEPSIPRETRTQLIDEALGGELHAYVVNFIKILCEKSALEALPACARAYLELLYKARGIMPVTAASAAALADEQKTALAQKLGNITGKKILLTNIVDEKLIGGVKVSYDGTELDGSVAGRLSAVRQALMSN